jgi:hypothetical protein
MSLRATAYVALTILAGSFSIACGSSADDDKGGTDPAVSGGSDGTQYPKADGTCADGYVKAGGACITLEGATPCKNPISTGFAGDDQCLDAPDPGTGIHMHYGPSNYDDPDELAKFTIEPQQELVDCMFQKTPNEEDVHMNTYHVRLRPGTHHMITYVQPGDHAPSTQPEPCNQGAQFTFLVGATSINTDISAVGAAKEYEGAAMLIKAKSNAAIQMHFINTTEDTHLKEGWINGLTVPNDEVKLETNPITWLGGIGMSIKPQTQVTVKGGTDAAQQLSSCEVTDATGPLNVMAVVAHAHSHTQRVAAYITRKDTNERVKFYEDYNWEEPTFMFYNSGVKNPQPDAQAKLTGGISGQLTAQPGDKLSWECEVHNDGASDVNTLMFSDKALTGEMCNIFGVYSNAADPQGATSPWACISL